MDKQVGNVQLMQQMNRLKVLDFVRRHPDVSRPCIAEHTGLSLPSITNTTSYLLELGLICESGVEKVGRVGRKSTLLRFSSGAYNLICIYLSDKYVNIAYTDLVGKTKDRIKINIENLNLDETMSELSDNLLSIINKHNNEQILGIGITISGLILDNSQFVLSSRLKWHSFDIKRTLEKITNIPVFIDNVSRTKAIWYFCQSGNMSNDNMLYVDMQNGIGAVQFFDGAITRSTLGEIGHTTVEQNGEECFCGNRGCLEAMCSPQRIISIYENLSGKKGTSLSTLDTLYKNDDSDAVYAITECGKYLGIGLANLINLFNPSVMVINTVDFDACPSLIKEAQAELLKRVYPYLTKKLVIKLISETDENIIYGTAFNLCDRLFDISYDKNIVK